jgi:hypothetical protein
MALFGLRWLELEQPAGGGAYAWLLVAGVTVLIVGIAARTVVAAAHGQLLPGRFAARSERGVNLPGFARDPRAASRVPAA